MLHKAIPLLPSGNLRATIDFYETRLGFTGTNRGNYAVVKSGNAEIHFFLVMDKAILQPAACIICTDNLEDLFINFAGKDMVYPAGKMDAIRFGKKEFLINDNNGNTIKFIQEIK